MVGVGLLAVAGVAVFLLDRGGTKPAGPIVPEHAGLAAPKDTDRRVAQLVRLEQDYRSGRPQTEAGYRRYIGYLKTAGPAGAALLQRVYRDYVEGPGAEDAEARRALGHDEFAHEIPESVSYRGYPFLQAVEAAFTKRWYGPSEKTAYGLAREAWAQTEAHVERLATDRGYRSQDGIRANISGMSVFGAYNYAARWAAPYLICYSGSDVTSKFDVMQEPDPAVRARKLKVLEQHRARYERILDEKAWIFQQVYAEYLRRYRTDLKLRDLKDAYGGSPDNPSGKRLFRDGVPMVVWVFSDHAAFQKHHERVGYGKISDDIAGYFSSRTGWVYLFDEPGDRQFEVNKNVHEAVHQLQYWFTRQRNEWSPPAVGQDFLGEGIAELLGAVKMDRKRNLTFQEVNPLRLKNIQLMTRLFRDKKRTYPLFPVEKLAGFGTYRDATRYASKEWGVSPEAGLALFYQQSWAFTYFLTKYKSGAYRKKLGRYLGRALDNETSYFLRLKAFKEAFLIRDASGFERIDKAYKQFFRYDIQTLDVLDWTYTPPGRYDWPK